MNIAFLESNTTGSGRLALARLLARGHRVVFLTRSPSQYPFLSSHAPGLEIVEIETNDVDTTAAWLEERSRRAGRFDALVTFSTYYVSAVAQLARRFGYRYLNPETARVCHDKHECRLALRGAGLPVPPFWNLPTEAAAEEVSAGVPYPCVMKPATDSGSVGVKLLRNRVEFMAHYRALAARRRNERDQPVGGVLAEGRLNGPEFSVETMTLAAGCTSIIGVTAKHLGEPPYFVEMGHDFPACLPADTRRSLEHAALSALEAVGYDFGPAHVEMRLTESGPVVVEINPRLAGGMIPELVRYALGIDLIDAVLDAVAGGPVRLEASRRETACIRFLTAGRFGRVRRPPPIEEARRIALVRDVECDATAGRTVRRAESAADRLGFVIASGSDRGAVLSAARTALGLLTLEVA